MDRWIGKTAVVTGGSSGIGAAICVELANAGLNVIGLARRPQLIEELKSQVQGRGAIHARQCDISKFEELTTVFKLIEETFGAVHIMINNAGVIHVGTITDISENQISDEQVHSIIDTNTTATILCSRLAISSMKKHGFNGHIININSIAGGYIPFSPLFNIYSASKFAVSAFTKALTNELSHLNSSIKVTSISPGLVDTPMAARTQNMHTLKAKDVADAVVYSLSTPPTVNISELTITPVGEKRM